MNDKNFFIDPQNYLNDYNFDININLIGIYLNHQGTRLFFENPVELRINTQKIHNNMPKIYILPKNHVRPRIRV